MNYGYNYGFGYTRPPQAGRFVDAFGGLPAMQVSGGTQNGVYTQRGEVEQRPYYAPSNQPNGGGLGAYNLTYGDDQWEILDQNGNPLYYSSDDVATPDFCTHWFNASDDSPAGITVTAIRYYAPPLIATNAPPPPPPTAAGEAQQEGGAAL